MSSQPQVFVGGHLELLIREDDPKERKRMKRTRSWIDIVNVDRTVKSRKEKAE